MSGREDKSSILESRNVTVAGRRTSMRLEPQMWDALESIARDEGVTLNALCTQIDQRRRRVGLTSATRIFIVGYYRDLLRRYQGQAPAKAPPLADRVLDAVVGRPSEPRPADGKPRALGWSGE